MDIAAGILMGLVGVLGVVLTLVGLPGTWLTLLVSVVIKFWRPELIDWPAIGIAGGLCVLAELAEFAAGAVGAKRVGGSPRSAIGAIVGGLFGAILGTFLIPIPLVGTVLGASIGAGVCAAAMELTLTDKTLAQAGRVGTGAFIGRLLATVFKTMFAVGVSSVLVTAVCVAGW